ncbi:MAG: GNAT family N-acetyltransferase [Dolichospermum circinale Clear-D4]|jgi:predicted GNAT family N-acyltransferase|nr:GNAT family N-acetyltransferase [Dolichospermum circinale Clear-D4]
MTYIICSINDKRVIRDNFDCGVSELNEYLKKYAKQNDKNGIAKTWVAILDNNLDNNVDVLGYYSISMAELKQDTLPEDYRQKLPRYPLPVIRIGKLAVAKSMQGKGLGETLLVDALTRGKRLADDIGVYGFTVDAINENAKNFYLSYGFIPLCDQQLSLFISLKNLKGLLS